MYDSTDDLCLIHHCVPSPHYLAHSSCLVNICEMNIDLLGGRQEGNREGREGGKKDRQEEGWTGGREGEREEEGRGHRKGRREKEKGCQPLKPHGFHPSEL